MYPRGSHKTPRSVQTAYLEYCFAVGSPIFCARLVDSETARSNGSTDLVIRSSSDLVAHPDWKGAAKLASSTLFGDPE